MRMLIVFDDMMEDMESNKKLSPNPAGKYWSPGRLENFSHQSPENVSCRSYLTIPWTSPTDVPGTSRSDVLGTSPNDVQGAF